MRPAPTARGSCGRLRPQHPKNPMHLSHIGNRLTLVRLAQQLMPEKVGLTDRRRRNRLAITLPVQVRGREASGGAWEEVASCLDASEGGVAIVMSHPVRTGQVLYLSVPLPSRFRQFDHSASSYRIYGLVRSSRAHEARSRIGVMFLGPTPPRGSEMLPADLYRLRGDREAQRKPATSLVLRLEAEDAPGGVEQQESAMVERLTATTAAVRVKYLPVGRGTVLTLETAGRGFRTRAEVTGISIEDMGHARLALSVLDAPFPDHLLTDESVSGN